MQTFHCKWFHQFIHDCTCVSLCTYAAKKRTYCISIIIFCDFSGLNALDASLIYPAVPSGSWIRYNFILSTTRSIRVHTQGFHTCYNLAIQSGRGREAHAQYIVRWAHSVPSHSSTYIYMYILVGIRLHAASSFLMLSHIPISISILFIVHTM